MKLATSSGLSGDPWMNRPLAPRPRGMRWCARAVWSMAVLSAVSCRSARPSAVRRFEPAVGACSSECAASAVVDVSTTFGADAPTCQGAVVGRRADAMLVLTAAHCLGGDEAPLPFVRARKASRPVAAARRWIHPLYTRGAPSAVGDLALLETPLLDGASVMPWSTPLPAPGEQLTLPGDGNEPARAATVRQASALTVTASPVSGSTFCTGQSGAPLTRGGSTTSVVAVVSRGAHDCHGDVVAARLGGLVEGFIDRVLDGTAVQRTSLGCGACMEVLSANRDECVTLHGRCEREPECASALRCVESCRDTPCLERCRAGHDAAPSFSALLRCACLRGCRTECDALCKS